MAVISLYFGKIPTEFDPEQVSRLFVLPTKKGKKTFVNILQTLCL
jgi:hypothetical protein